MKSFPSIIFSSLLVSLVAAASGSTCIHPAVGEILARAVTLQGGVAPVIEETATCASHPDIQKMAAALGHPLTARSFEANHLNARGNDLSAEIAKGKAQAAKLVCKAGASHGKCITCQVAAGVTYVAAGALCAATVELLPVALVCLAAATGTLIATDTSCLSL